MTKTGSVIVPIFMVVCDLIDGRRQTLFHTSDRGRLALSGVARPYALG